MLLCLPGFSLISSVLILFITTAVLVFSLLWEKSRQNEKARNREREEGRKITRKALGINIIWLNTVYAYCSTSKSSALFLNWYCMSSNNTAEGCWLDASIFSCSSFFITKKKHNSRPAVLFDYSVTLSYTQLCTSTLFVDQGKDELWLEGSLGDLTAQRQADKLYYIFCSTTELQCANGWIHTSCICICPYSDNKTDLTTELIIKRLGHEMFGAFVIKKALLFLYFV